MLNAPLKKITGGLILLTKNNKYINSMPPVKCQKCKFAVNSRAEFCPNCYARVRKIGRSGIGKIIKYGFVLFTIIMPLWLVSDVYFTASGDFDSANIDAAEAISGFGAGIWVLMKIGIWVGGSVILGILTLVTRPK